MRVRDMMRAKAQGLRNPITAQLRCDATGVLLSEGTSYGSCTSIQQGRLNVPMEDICGKKSVLGGRRVFIDYPRKSAGAA